MGFFASFTAAIRSLFTKKPVTGDNWRGFNAIKTTKVDKPEDFQRLNDS